MRYLFDWALEDYGLQSEQIFNFWPKFNLTAAAGQSLVFIGVQKWCVYAGVCLHEHTHDCLALLGDQMEAWWVVLHATAGGEGAIIGGLRLCQPPVCVSHTHTHLTRTHVHTSAHCDRPPHQGRSVQWHSVSKAPFEPGETSPSSSLFISTLSLV